MHMISKKDLNSAELETMTTSRCATTVITANGEVQTYEEATVYVKELDMWFSFPFLFYLNLDGTPSAERTVRRVEEGSSAVLWQSGLDEKWWTDSRECYTYL